MSDELICPYCGATPWSEVPKGLESTIRIRCDRCGGIFEYMPGFGSFSLPDMGQSSAREIPAPGPTYSDGSTAYGDIRRQIGPPEQESDCSGCGVCCCILIFFIFIDVFFSLMLFPWG